MAAALLQFRVLSGNPPSLAQVQTPVIAEWARQGRLGNVDIVARTQNWDALLPLQVRAAVQHDGKYVAVPVNVHRLNWLWINTSALERAGASVPSTWQEFFDTAEKLKRAGFVALAHGGEQWQDHLLFQTVALGVGGGEFYVKALLEFDPAALSSLTMEQVLLTFRRLKQYTQPKEPARRWMKASEMLINGSAGMQFMGDWAKPTFTGAKARSGWAFHCTAAPGTAQYFLFATDAFAVFRPDGAEAARAQLDFAGVAMSAPVQTSFNLAKGSIPVRLDMDARSFDHCGVIAVQAYRRAAHNGNLIPNATVSARRDVEQRIPAITSAFWRDGRITPQTAMKRLVQAVRQHP
ncbi:ABC transporter substrate-binding protein [Pseudoduganella lutea]|nr:ABC transporter substrate-binding protein [Pseudoduganella lutea]